MAQFVVNNDVDKQILLERGVPLADIVPAGTPGAIYVGAAGKNAPSGAQKLEGSDRYATDTLVGQYLGKTNAGNVTSQAPTYTADFDNPSKTPTYVVSDDVDRQILLDAGIVPTSIYDINGGNAPAGSVYVGAAGNYAPAGSTIIEGQTRTQTAQQVAAYTANVTQATTNAQNGQSIYSVIAQQLQQWGISELDNEVKQLLTQGLSQDAVMVQLQNSDAYKQRFAGNQIRMKNGLGVLSPADYISTEAAYDQVLRQYGIAAHFGTRDNFAKWIGNDVSATEVQSRAQEAMNLVQQSDPTARNLLKKWYGVNSGDILATFLDPTQAQATLDRKAFAANVGAELQRDNFDVSEGMAAGLYGEGTQDQVLAGIQNAGLNFRKTQQLAERYGAQYTEQDALNQYVRGDTAPALIQQQLAQQEEAQFSRGSGVQSAGAGVSSGF